MSSIGNPNASVTAYGSKVNLSQTVNLSNGQPNDTAAASQSDRASPNTSNTASDSDDEVKDQEEQGTTTVSRLVTRFDFVYFHFHLTSLIFATDCHANENSLLETKKEVQRFQVGTIDKEEAKNIFIEELKKSGETKLNFDQAVFEAWFEKADANHDG